MTITFPKDVRLAQEGDEKRVFDLCCLAHAENGWGTMSPEIVTEAIRKATHREGSVLAIIDGAERVEAALGLHPCLPWQCDPNVSTNWYWGELFWFVHPLHRRSRHAMKLFRFAQWWEQEIKQPVLISLMPRDHLEKKERLAARFGTRIGSTFLIGDRQTYQEVAGNA